MEETVQITDEEVARAYDQLKADALGAGYFLHPDRSFVSDLIRGILTNEKRYGYGLCPCRLSSGDGKKDRDIQCPCDYRDPDLKEFGQCYCGLYVSEEVSAQPEKCIGCIPERRPGPGSTAGPERLSLSVPGMGPGLTHPVWRCSVCGYLCARDDAPSLCPICKARQERFERFM